MNTLKNNSLSPEKLLHSVDWKMLKKQKEVLLEVIYQEENQSNMDIVESLEGILHLIDALQDCAVIHLGIDEKIVFNPLID